MLLYSDKCEVFSVSKSIDRYITLQSTDFMRNQCNSLKAFGIVGFNHDVSFPMGELSMLTTEKNVFRLWFNKRMSAICTDESGRVLNAGVYLDKILGDNHKDVIRQSHIFLAQFNANRIIHIIERESDCQSMYSFLFHQIAENDFLHWSINNVSILYNFLEKYKYFSKELIKEVKKPANRIVLPLSHPADDRKDELSKVNTDSIPQHIIHKQSDIPIYLSRQQSICLALLMQGKTAKEIAIHMNLSFRTVQHYFERIRKILGCVSNKALIISYGDQVISEKWDSIRNLFEQEL